MLMLVKVCGRNRGKFELHELTKYLICQLKLE